jgi:hypothetical protein
VSEVPHFVINSTPSLSKFRMIKIRVMILNGECVVESMNSPALLQALALIK